MYLEEEFLFPPIREAGLLMPVMVMIREHGALWQLMDALTELLDENDPADVDDELLSTCRALLDQLDQHNSKEEPIIYPHADADLDEQAAAHLVDFLESGRTPAGWVCEAAR
ncbi:hemerythrin domain-containing protein [Pseudolysinimonas kribbensis]|uniref:hemerythrin domain-containing protein n=1 Tax=Pseudolysinimonas kribbensis TaxID=433641 RepID=UPI0024E078B4|nr:hemerythrin domain-containing protein [Pseudolysinimonas kribbensis]